MKRLSACALSLALSVSMILPAGAAGAAFTDVPQDHWANPYVEAMTQKGVVTGVGNGRFNPDGNLSTAEFAVMLTQAFCPEAVADPEEGGAWWEPYLDAAWSAGYLIDTTAGFSYIDGIWDVTYTDGTWNEDVVTEPMTRYDMAQAMYNTVVAEGMALPTDEQREAAQAAIGDFASIPEDYESAVVAMYALGYLSGVNANGDFGGESTMTRAQSCVVMSKLLGTEVETTPETPDEGTAGGTGDTTPAEEPETPAEDAGTGTETPEKPETPDEGTAGGTAGTTPVEEETPAEDAGSEPADTVAAYEQEVFDLVNQIREENGLEPFVYNETLAETARAHSQDMIDRNFFDHTNPDGKSPFDRMRDNGLSYSMAAENIAMGYPSPEAVVEGWMNSDGHRANILGGCEELGVGLALGGSYGYYWTQCFATVR